MRHIRIQLIILFILIVSQNSSGFAQDSSTENYREIAHIDLALGSDVAWSPDGGQLAVADFPAIYIFDTTLWQLELAIRDASANEVVWSPDGSQIASVAGGDNEYPYESLYIRDAHTGELLKHLKRPYVGPNDYLFILPMARLSWSPDGMRIASDSHALDVLIWDLSNDEVSILGSYKSGRVGETDWSPDSTQVVSEGGDGKIRIWDVATGKSLVTIRGTGSVDWHPFNNRIAGVTPMGASVWDTNTGRQLLTLSNEASVLQVTWNFDGTIIATGDLAGIIRIWDAQSGEVVMTIEEHKDLITALAWHPDQNLLASTSYDGYMRVWQIN